MNFWNLVWCLLLKSPPSKQVDLFPFPSSSPTFHNEYHWFSQQEQMNTCRHCRYPVETLLKSISSRSDDFHHFAQATQADVFLPRLNSLHQIECKIQGVGRVGKKHAITIFNRDSDSGLMAEILGRTRNPIVEGLLILSVFLKKSLHGTHVRLFIPNTLYSLVVCLTGWSTDSSPKTILPEYHNSLPFTHLIQPEPGWLLNILICATYPFVLIQ